MARTIKELSAVCGVSEQAIRKWCARNQVAKDVSQHYIIDETTESLILGHYGVKVAKHSETSCETSFATNETTDELIELLKEQLKEKDKQIEQLHKSLDQAQQLQAMAETKTKLLEQQKEEITNMKPRQFKKWWKKNK